MDIAATLSERSTTRRQYRPNRHASVASSVTGPAERHQIRRQTLLARFQLLLQRFRECLIGIAPLRQTDLLDVFVHRFRHGPVEVLWPCRSEHARRDGRVGHHRCALGHGVADLAHLFDVFVIELAEVVPNTREARHDVGLIAAVRDHVMRPLLQSQVFATEIPADVHQLHRIERAASLPRRACRVRALALEGVFD